METVSTPANTPAQAETYTKEQLEHIVKERLARDRDARGNETAEKIAEAERKAEEAKTALQNAHVTIEALKGTSATAEEVTSKVKESHAKIVASIPAEKQKYLPSVSEADQLVFIAKNPELFFPTSVQAPVTPLPVNNQGGEFHSARLGGYSSEIEFAQRDPKGYMASKREGKI